MKSSSSQSHGVRARARTRLTAVASVAAAMPHPSSRLTVRMLPAEHAFRGELNAKKVSRHVMQAHLRCMGSYGGPNDKVCPFFSNPDRMRRQSVRPAMWSGLYVPGAGSKQALGSDQRK